MAKKQTAEGMSINQQMAEILKIAQKHGVEQNFFFITTFKRYQVQISILTNLEKIIKNDGLLVSKEYVKGRQNVYSHPAIKDYNRTTDSANKTVSVLLKVIHDLRRDSSDVDADEDPLMTILLQGGSMGDDDNESELEDFEDDDENDDDDEDDDEDSARS